MDKKIKQDAIQYKEAIEYLEFEDFDDEDDILSTLEGNILGDLKPWFYCDSSEIGYPAKFATKILDEEKWQIKSIVRSPSLQKNKLLSDDKIISEIKGNTGVSNITLNQECSIQHKAKFNEIKENANETLKYNPVWRNHIKIFFSEIDKLEDYDLNIHLFNSNNIILDLMHIVAKQDFHGYCPNYQLKIHKSTHTKIYFGMLHWNKKAPNFQKLLEKFYDNDTLNVLMRLAWGGHESNNDEILEELGLTYESYLVDEKNGNTNIFLFKNFKFQKVMEVKDGLEDFIENNSDFMKRLDYLYNKHHHETKIKFN